MSSKMDNLSTNMGKKQKDLIDRINQLFSPGGFECYPFLVGWYNNVVSKEFRLHYDENTLTFIVVSTPSMFEKGFMEFIKNRKWQGARDPIDECIANYFETVKADFSSNDIDCIYDYERHHNRRPKVLVQSAGHVAGAAFFYQRKHVQNDPWEQDKKICGVAIHPVYGGWFALRGIMVFKDILAPDLPQREPQDAVASNTQRIKLLESFNYHWQNWSFRDIIPVKEKYSQNQLIYFGTPPKDRKELIENLQVGKVLPRKESEEITDAGHQRS